MSAAVRPVQLQDREVVGQIAYATGFFGDSAARYFPAPRFFAALWVGAYFRGGGFGGYVAEVNGEVVGYILGAPSGAQYRCGLLRALPLVLASLPSPPTLWPCLRYLLRAARFHAPQADPRLYPAHLHLNLLPSARGHRLGERLLQAHLTVLAGAGVRGVQLSTTAENVAALGLYRKAGFTIVERRTTPLWRPWLGRETAQIVMGLDLRGLTGAELGGVGDC